jgi:hypothetical protein
VLVLLAMLSLSCFEDRCTSLQPEGCPTTGDGLVDALEEAWEARDIDAYGALLHEDFRFGFTPSVAEEIGLPEDSPYWGKERDLASTRNLFEYQNVVATEMELGTDESWTYWEGELIDSSGAEPETTVIEGFTARFTPLIKVTIAESGQEPITLLVDRSWLDFMVTPSDDSLGSCWSIIEIREYEIPERGLGSLMAPEGCTWSAIKGMFE